MTFEEFFKKKRIDLTALDKAEPALFSEFKTHFEQMGEKSFDHTKKYWFNKLRHEFHLAPEVKTDKPAIANPLAEQTITESLSETVQAAPLPKVGFVPRFKAANMAKPPVEADKKEETLPAPDAETPDTAQPEESPPPKPAYKPRFNMKNIPPKAEE
jgi:hypothetical protein